MQVEAGFGHRRRMIAETPEDIAYVHAHFLPHAAVARAVPPTASPPIAGTPFGIAIPAAT